MRLGCTTVMLVSTQANWNSSLVTSDYNLVRSDCMLVILENILVKLLVDNLNILQLVVHMMVTMVQKAVESYQGFGWFENYAQKFHTSRIYFFWNFKPNLAYMVTLVTYHQRKPGTVQAKIREKIQHHFQVIDKVKMMQFQVFWKTEKVKSQLRRSQIRQSNQKMAWQLHLDFLQP